MPNQTATTSARIVVNGITYNFSSTAFSTTHTDSEFSFRANSLSFEPLPKGAYLIYFRLPKSTKAGTYALGTGDIRATFDMPGAAVLNGYNAISGSVTFTEDPTSTKLRGHFNFVGKSNNPDITGLAQITDGKLDMDTEQSAFSASEGTFKVSVDINSLPSSASKDESAVPTEKDSFEAKRVSMGPAAGAPYLQVEAVQQDTPGLKAYIFIPNGKLETETELDIKDDENGQYAIAVFQHQRYFYYASRGHLRYKYDAVTKNLTADFNFHEGDNNHFTDGELNIKGLDKR